MLCESNIELLSADRVVVKAPLKISNADTSLVTLAFSASLLLSSAKHRACCHQRSSLRFHAVAEVYNTVSVLVSKSRSRFVNVLLFCSFCVSQNLGKISPICAALLIVSCLKIAAVSAVAIPGPCFVNRTLA